MASDHENASHPLEPVYKKMSSIYDERTAQEFAAHLIPHLQPHHRILDVGCGQGSITTDLAQLVPDGDVLGIDISQTFIDGALNLAKERKIPNAEFKVMDANDLSSLPEQSFDVVHEHQVLLQVPDPIHILRELRRVLKPSGILSMRDNVSM